MFIPDSATRAGLAAAVLAAMVAGTAWSDAPPPLQAGLVTTHFLPAPGQNRTRPVLVYQPKGTEMGSVPVLYFLHGVPGQAVDGVECGFVAAIDREIAAGARPFAVVMPDGNGIRHSDTEWADAIDGKDLIDTFVTDTVVHAVEGGHSIPRSQRAMSGFSMGGYGAMNLALRHPQLFGQVASIAGYYHIDDTDKVFGHDRAVQEANRPFDHVPDMAQFRIYLSDGDHDEEPAVKGDPQRLKARLDALGIPALLVIKPGTHSWEFVNSQVPDMVRFLEAGWDSSPR